MCGGDPASPALLNQLTRSGSVTDFPFEFHVPTHRRRSSDKEGDVGRGEGALKRRVSMAAWRLSSKKVS
jgi:hypothetical protein